MEEKDKKEKGETVQSEDSVATPETSNDSVANTTADETEATQEDEKAYDNLPAGPDDLSDKVTASANYLGSVFSSAWNRTAKTANDGTSYLSSAFTKVAAGTEDNKESDKKEEEGSLPNAATSLFNSALSSFSGLTGGATTSEEKPEETKEGGFGIDLTSAFSQIGKVAADATSSIKDLKPNMLSEFNKEQEQFIKSKGQGNDVAVAPWVGFQNEEELKAKILTLSEDKRNFVRAPPSGVSFEFEYSSVSATAIVLLQEDPTLNKMRYDLVPKQVKEEEFWRNYFYRLSLIKQSFELKDLEQDNSKKRPQERVKKPSETDILEEELNVNDDEFVSDSYQASTSDIAEANEQMKQLGVVGDNPEEWEAELEGELNEFEVVNGKAENNQEWENQIQEMLEAEEKK